MERVSNRQMVVVFSIGLSVAGCGTPVHSPTQAPTTTSPERAESGETDVSMVGQLFLDDVNGGSHDVAELLVGRATLISFWATYCNRCRQKIEDHQRLHDTYADDGLAVIAVSVDEPETIGQVRAFARQRSLTIPVLLDPDCKLIDQLNPRRTLPFSLLLDESGRTVWTHEGYAAGDRELFERVVVEALGVEVAQ